MAQPSPRWLGGQDEREWRGDRAQHPIGASGARIVATLLHELNRRDGRYGLATLCLGGGGSVAAAFERVA
jgi:hypothetical protein